MIGRIAAFVRTGGWNGFSGCTGVAKAGEDEGIGLDGPAGFLGAKNPAAGGGCGRDGPASAFVWPGFALFGRGLWTIMMSVIFALQRDVNKTRNKHNWPPANESVVMMAGDDNVWKTRKLRNEAGDQTRIGGAHPRFQPM